MHSLLTSLPSSTLPEQPITLFSAKCKSLLKQRKKPAKLTWTQVYTGSSM